MCKHVICLQSVVVVIHQYVRLYRFTGSALLCVPSACMHVVYMYVVFLCICAPQVTVLRRVGFGGGGL